MHDTGVLATLLDRQHGDELPLGAGLTKRYGGLLRFPARRPYVFANFVSTIDGVVSYDVPGIESAAEVSRGNDADRFVLALLRAVADAVVVGAGTLRKEASHVWTPEHVYPHAKADFAALRASLGLRPRPLTVIVTASGELDLSLPVFRSEVVIATTAEAARGMSAPPGVRVVAVAERAPLPPRDIVALAAREAAGGRVLTEGGPSLLGSFLEHGVVDELFLTVAPHLAGRSDNVRRLALVEGVAFTPAAAPRGRLISVKSADDYLFTRFALTP